MADDASFQPSPPAVRRPFADPEELIGAAQAASATCSNILAAFGRETPHDGDLRDLAYDAGEALHFVLRQIEEPTASEKALLGCLEPLLDNFARARTAEREAIAGQAGRFG